MLAFIGMCYLKNMIKSHDIILKSTNFLSYQQQKNKNGVHF